MIDQINMPNQTSNKQILCSENNKTLDIWGNEIQERFVLNLRNHLPVYLFGLLIYK